MKSFLTWILGRDPDEPEAPQPELVSGEMRRPVSFVFTGQFKGDFCSNFCDERIAIEAGFRYFMGFRPHYCRYFQRNLKNNWSLPGDPRQERCPPCKRVQQYAPPIDLNEVERTRQDLVQLRTKNQQIESELTDVRTRLHNAQELLDQKMQTEENRLGRRRF
jgi:hypothetical protein